MQTLPGGQQQLSDPKVILVTEASTGIGRLAVGALAHGGHTVYAGIADCRGSRRRQADRFRAYARDHGVDARPIALDPTADRSATSAVARIVREQGRLDVIVHNALQPMFGPAEAFAPAQLIAVYDRGIVGVQRLMRAALPHMRRRAQGLMIWVVSSAASGGAAPYLAFYCSLAAALEALAVQYARELARWGIDTSIVVPGMFGEIFSPLKEALPPEDAVRAAEYEAGVNRGLEQTIRDAALRIMPKDPIPGAAVGAIAMIVEMPAGDRPFRICVDPAHDGAEVVMPVLDRVREEMMRRLGLADLLSRRCHRSDRER
jgi:NAD(P)-dependent dehydrogenase (short-subunit alcohol dehydrogenase family)